MKRHQANDHYGPPMSAPPSYSQAVGGVPPVSPYTQYYKSNMVNSTPIVTTVVPVGPNATHMICPNCHAEVETSIRKEPGLIAYITGAVIALLGGIWGCCLIPCCIDSCLDVHHTCPNCENYIGRYRR